MKFENNFMKEINVHHYFMKIIILQGVLDGFAKCGLIIVSYLIDLIKCIFS